LLANGGGRWAAMAAANGGGRQMVNGWGMVNGWDFMGDYIGGK